MLGLALLLATAPVPSGLPDIVVVGDRRFAAPAVPDVQLARMRGGVRLPNGLNVAIGIDLQTWRDGMLILHTIYASDGPNAGIRVYTDGSDAPRTAPATATVETEGMMGLPTLVVDRSPTGTTIRAGTAVPATTVNLVNGDPGTWLDASGQTRVPAAVDGPAVAAAPGDISVRSAESGAVVTLTAPMLEVRQLIGRATGAVILNTGNDRTIETVSSINVDLQGLSPGVMAGIFAAQRAVVDAVTR